MLRRVAVLLGLSPVVLAASLGSCVPGYVFADDDGGGARPDADATVLADVMLDAAADGAESAPPIDFDSGVMVRIPEGGPFGFQGDAQATLTHAFRLDRFEVTVGRFKAWHAAGRPLPCGGAACELDANGPYAGRMKWDPGWNGNVGVLAYAGSGCNVARGTSYSTATFTLGDDALPVSCVNWYQAVAFCFSEGRRLLTETEWEYVASGRGAGRQYPWGNVVPDCAHATWFNNDNVAHNGCGWPKPAGYADAGASLDHAFDLAGSVYEWVWDYQAGNVPSPATDYAGPATGTYRGTRGGSFGSDQAFISTTARDSTDPAGTYADVGFRCAQTLP